MKMLKRETMPLRERLEWLIEAAQTRRYGDFLSTANIAFSTEYLVAIGQAGKKEGCGAVSARLLRADLTELVDRGILSRTRTNRGYVYTVKARDSGLDVKDGNGEMDRRPNASSV
ncbi:hypothetical protein AWB75_05111 [Caballeronia catudaia]|uniref:Uncharacterized protein n=1 Tax=Caballeronia catudaia TaxID=1777136 RepID=A0A158CIV3_9BURK|nr:hypothetical protein [Caballeronia catudaia]SAK81447.1 hypothetical protein AWB75_05111 [Caballeronia catudaia]